jgi:hypothetical protein
MGSETADEGRSRIASGQIPARQVALPRSEGCGKSDRGKSQRSYMDNDQVLAKKYTIGHNPLRD